MADEIRVLFVDHETRLSGGEQDLLDLVDALVPLGRTEVHAAVPEQGPLPEALQRAGVAVHFVAMPKGLRTLSRSQIATRPWAILGVAWALAIYMFKLGRLIDRIDPHVVHTNSMKSHFLAGWVARSRGVPVAWHVRDILPTGWLRRFFAFTGWRLADRILCISEAVKEQFRGTSAYTKSKVIYNGIDLSRFAKTTGKGWRKKLGARSGEPLVGIVGQIAHWKGQDVFIKAAARVLVSHPKARFAVVGECLFPDNESAFERSIHDLAQELEVQDRLVFTGWTDEPEEVMSALDVVVHASRLPEPFGRVIIEGMAAGKPVVVSAEGAGPELVVTPAEGRVVPADDPDLLALAIGEFVGDEKTRKLVGNAARTGAERFAIANTAAAVLAQYETLLGHAI